MTGSNPQSTDPDLRIPPELAGLSLADLEAAAGLPWPSWAQQCHAVSLAVVRSGALGSIGPSRVVRGTAAGVGGQHSWIALGPEVPIAMGPAAVDVYDPATWYLDLTLWSYRSDAPLVVLDTGYDADADPLADLYDEDDADDGLEPVADLRLWEHLPHGSGSLFDAPMPRSGGGPAIELTSSPRGFLSASARNVLQAVGPLDAAGWAQLAGSPCGTGPMPEILEAMAAHTELAALLPVDRLGNATGLNPQGLYW